MTLRLHLRVTRKIVPFIARLQCRCPREASKVLMAAMIDRYENLIVGRGEADKYRGIRGIFPPALERESEGERHEAHVS